MKAYNRLKIYFSGILLSLIMVLFCVPSTVFAEEAVASVEYGGKTETFPSLEAAVDDFNSKGGTLKLLKDVERTLESGKSLIELKRGGTFDLNGHKIKLEGGSAAIKVTATGDNILIKDSSEEQTGSISGSSYSVWHNGTRDVTIESGNYVNVGRIYTGSLIINGGTFTNPYPLYDNTSAEEGKLCLYGGTFEYGVRVQNSSAEIKTTVSSILGTDTLTYEVGGEIWARSRVDALGNVNEFESGKCVTVVEESSAVASYSYYDGPNDTTPSTSYWTTLNGAISKCKEYSGYGEYVTLLKNSTEDVIIDGDIRMSFMANASGVFTFDTGCSIFLNAPLPEGMQIRAKKTEYTCEFNMNHSSVLCVAQDVEATVSADDIVAVDNGAKAYPFNTMIVGLIHEHSWNHVLTEENDRQTITAYCQYPESCTLDKDYVVASVTIHDEDFQYDGAPHTGRIDTRETNIYNRDVPSDLDIIYYDENGNKLEGAPIYPGNYTAKVTLGDKTAEADLKINHLVPTADMFDFAAENHIYDGTPKEAEVTVKDSISGMGPITIYYYDSQGNLLDEAPVDAGTYQVKISVEESYKYEKADGITSDAWTFTIEPKPVNAAISFVEEDIVYNGKAQEPVVYAKDGDTIIPASEYTAVYSDNTLPGTAMVTLVDKEGGNYIVSGDSKFVIHPAPTLEDNPLDNEPLDDNLSFDEGSKRPADDDNPETGDNNNYWIWLLLLLASGTCLCLSCFKNYKRK